MSKLESAIAIKGIGEVELGGQGPWRVRPAGGTFDIVDDNGTVINPTIWNTTGGANTVKKASQGVVFAKQRDAQSVVDAFNAKLKA